jgi:hypothetical protein
VQHPILAVLLPEPQNPYDTNAVRVLIEGSLVGYLSRDDAEAYLPGLLRNIAFCATGQIGLNGTIFGGGPRRDGIGFLGVFLDHNPADFGIAPHYTTGGTLRTGLSEALATDLDDETYDLSWLKRLADEDGSAIAQVRALLGDERDPIDRHYMLCELEHRLYLSRATDPSALDAFDGACRLHDVEMITIRPALFEKFGVVPVIEMYRQAAIRWQKEKDWESVRVWAERGLAIYGDDAARPEAVEDLHKRIAYAALKIDQPPKVRGTKRTHVHQGAVSSEPRFETLVCQMCGARFEREVTRGRKPSSCPACRGGRPG